MEASKIICVLAILLILLVVFMRCRKDKAGLAVPQGIQFVPVSDPRTGYTTQFIQYPDMPQLSQIDFAGMTNAPMNAPLDKATSDQIVSQYLTVQDLLPTGTMNGIQAADIEDRVVNVTLKSRYMGDANPWAMGTALIEPVNSIHRMFDVDKFRDRTPTAYDEFDPELAQYNLAKGYNM